MAAYWGTFAFFLLYILLAMMCLRQWGSEQPWSRVDFFSGGYIVISLAWLLQTLDFHKVVFQSPEVMREASGLGYDPLMLRGISILSLAELSVFYDYGHWRLTPRLEIPWLQALGLVLSGAGVAWLWWVDRYLTRHFSGDLAKRELMTHGPYRWVRHPRYLALLGSRAAFALTFASGLAWGFAVLWLLLILRRIRLEEAHMREVFGAAYEVYCARTARLLPGAY
jgi:protein-S-isoprenylcysteine O-methyltransferase Ste14